MYHPEAVPRQCADADEKHQAARRILKLTGELDLMLQPHTESVCPACEEVCCRNRFSQHDKYDLAFLRLIGHPPPVYAEGIGDGAPCQFLAQQGCTIGRFARPYRCNWFFCKPLIGHISTALPAPKYRDMIRLFSEISRLRLALIP